MKEKDNSDSTDIPILNESQKKITINPWKQMILLLEILTTILLILNILLPLI